jgi:arylsulfatase A-like enzyme
VSPATGTDHTSPYTYDTHVPLAFYGLPFQPGTYRTSVETVDLAVTLASLLGINAPTHAVGRVLIEGLAPPHRIVSGEGQP